MDSASKTASSRGADLSYADFSVRYHLSKNPIKGQFFDHLGHPSKMASVDPQDSLSNRSSDGNPSVQPKRVMFDVSELPVGAYLNSVAPTLEGDEAIKNWDSIN
jgi:hypothetical protein